MRYAVLALLSAAASLAQDAYPLESIAIRGAEQFAEARIAAATGLKVGDKVTAADFNKARDRLIATGAFENVGFAYKPSAAKTGYDLTFEVTEARPLLRYRIEALGKPEAELRAELARREPLFDDRIPALPQVMNRFNAALSALTGIEVIGGVSADVANELTIVFRPAGARSNISRVEFTGNEVFPTPELTRVMSGVAIGVPYSEVLFRRMVENSLTPIYEERGRIRVAFPSIATRKDEENEGLVVTISVQEGPSYKLGGVEITGVPSAQAQALAKEAAFRTGEIANFTEIKAGLDRMKRRFYADGYIRVEFPMERDIRDTEHIVNLTVNVQPGPRYEMGELRIVGLTILTEPAIRKAWTLKKGDPYNYYYADQFVQRLQAEGWFDNLDRAGAQAEIDDDRKVVDVTLTFVGGRVAPEDQRKRR